MARLTEQQRKTTIMVAAHRIATDTGIWDVTHGNVAERCVVPTSVKTVKRAFPTKDDLWRSLLEFAPNDEKLRLDAASVGFEG